MDNGQIGAGLGGLASGMQNAMMMGGAGGMGQMALLQALKKRMLAKRGGAGMPMAGGPELNDGSMGMQAPDPTGGQLPGPMVA